MFKKVHEIAAKRESCLYKDPNQRRDIHDQTMKDRMSCKQFFKLYLKIFEILSLYEFMLKLTKPSQMLSEITDKY